MKDYYLTVYIGPHLLSYRSPRESVRLMEYPRNDGQKEKPSLKSDGCKNRPVRFQSEFFSLVIRPKHGLFPRNRAFINALCTLNETIRCSSGDIREKTLENCRTWFVKFYSSSWKTFGHTFKSIITFSKLCFYGGS
jgi:hypothetical protein